MSVLNYLTPCYIVDADVFSENLTAFQNAFARYWNGSVAFGYSIKTNHAPAFLKLAKQLGMYAESVSDDEYYASLFAGYEKENVIFNGPQKSEELLEVLFSSACIINFDNAQDIAVLENYVAKGFAVKAKIGLRVNFDMESRCPGEMTAGQEVSRFGFCVENGDFSAAVAELHRMGIPVSGLHMHYSSRTRSERVFRELAAMAAELVQQYELKEELSFIDMGGGFFYGKNIFAQGKPTLDVYAKVIAEELEKAVSPDKVQLILEPGAALISAAVTYHTEVINQRFVRGVNILTVDGSKLHIDPFMTGRKPVYDICGSGMASRDTVSSQIICGSTCMENDRLIYLDEYTEIKKGDMVICKYAGAYTMGFNSCFINLPPFVYLKQGEDLQLVRKKGKDLLMQI